MEIGCRAAESRGSEPEPARGVGDECEMMRQLRGADLEALLPAPGFQVKSLKLEMQNVIKM